MHRTNKRGQIPEALVGFLTIALFVFALFQFNAYRNNLAKSAYNVAGIEQAYNTEEYFKQVVRDGLEKIAEENKNRKTFVGPPVDARDLTDSDEEFFKRKFKEFVENEIKKKEDKKQELALAQLKQLKAYMESDKLIYNFNDGIKVSVPGIIFQYGAEKFYEEEYKGSEITLVYHKDFIFNVGGR